MYKRQTQISAALLLAGFAGAASAGWNQLDLNQPSNLDEQENVIYQGSFNYNGQTYEMCIRDRGWTF